MEHRSEIANLKPGDILKHYGNLYVVEITSVDPVWCTAHGDILRGPGSNIRIEISNPPEWILLEETGCQTEELHPAEVFEDNWKHRSTGMRCRTCMWFVPKEEPQPGRCRKRAPTMDGFPVVFESDWCGDHKLNCK